MDTGATPPPWDLGSPQNLNLAKGQVKAWFCMKHVLFKYLGSKLNNKLWNSFGQAITKDEEKS